MEFTPEELEAVDTRSLSPSQVTTAKEAVRLVAAKWKVTQVDLVAGRRRWARVSAARRDLWRLLYEAGWSYPEIAEFTGRDHTTIMAGVKKAGGTSRPQPQNLRKGSLT